VKELATGLHAPAAPRVRVRRAEKTGVYALSRSNREASKESGGAAQTGAVAFFDAQALR
jgi:hypothetical protein